MVLLHHVASLLTCSLGAVYRNTPHAQYMHARSHPAQPAVLLPASFRDSQSHTLSAAGTSNSSQQGLPEGSPVEFEVELVGFQHEPNWADLGPDEKLSRAEKWKEQGNALYKQGRYKQARLKYQKAARVVERALDLQGEEQLGRGDAIKIACFLNLAQCCLKEESFGEAISLCNKALDPSIQQSKTERTEARDRHRSLQLVDVEHGKAYFRRATAQAALGEFALAREDLRLAAQLQPKLGDEVERELRRLAAREAQATQKQKREFKSFFDR